MWDVDEGELIYNLKGHANHVTCLASLSNGCIASGSRDATIRIWELGKLQAVNTLSEHEGPVLSLVVLENENLASYSKDNTIKVWDLSEGHQRCQQLLSITGHGNMGFLIHMGMLSDGSLVTCSRDERSRQEAVIKSWNPETGNQILALATKTPGVCALLVLLDDRVVVGFNKGTIKIFNLKDESQTIVLESFHTNAVECLYEFPDGSILSTSSVNNPTISIWRPEDPQGSLKQFTTDHKLPISSMGMSFDGTLLASCSIDQTVKIWQLKN